MSEGRLVRKSDAKEAAAKSGFFKANPPKREQKNADEDDADEADLALQTESLTGNEEPNASEKLEDNEEEAGENDRDAGDNGSGEPLVKRRRRRKRRILLTDTAVKAKKRAEKRQQKETNPFAESEKKEGAESPTKKEKVASPEPVNEKPKPAKYTPDQLFYDHILRKLISKDPEEFFAHPVQPSMAPDYLTIIEQPMEFQTIRQRIDAKEYESIDQFRRDVDLIWENAMTYNQPNTIYYTAAHKLSVLAKYYLSEQYLQYLRYTLPFGRQLAAITGFDDQRLTGGARRKQNARDDSASAAAKRREKYIVDNQKPADIIKAVEANLKSRLTDRMPACGIGYLDNNDGALALNILVNAGTGGDAAESNEKRRLTLGDIVPPLESGNPGVLSVAEPRLCHDYAISYTKPGPFASFAPQFDTTWATMNKYDSELLTACYGDRANAADALALRQMVADIDGDESSEFVRHVDALLDSLTDGEHSRTINALSERPRKEIAAKPLSRAALRRMLENVKTLQNLGLDLSYITDLTTELGLNADPAPIIDPLSATGAMLHDLATLNYQRLSGCPPLMLTDAASPSAVETQLAQSVAGALNAGLQAVGATPADVVSAQAIHKSLGLAGNDDDYDYDLLREFMCVDDLDINTN